MKRTFTTTVAAIALTAGLALPLTAQDTQLSGTVADVFDGQIVVNTSEGRLLVTLPDGTAAPQAGTDVTMSGARDGANFTATQIDTAAAAQSAPTATGGGNTTALPAALQDLGLTNVLIREDDDRDLDIYGELPGGGWVKIETDGRDQRIDEIKTDGTALPDDMIAAFLPEQLRNAPRVAEMDRIVEIELDDDGEIKIEGFAADGMRVEIDFERNGEMDDYEVSRDDRRSLTVEDARAAFANLGYTQIGYVDRSGRHVTAIALNPNGEQVEVRLDEEGRVSRERMFDRR